MKKVIMIRQICGRPTLFTHPVSYVNLDRIADNMNSKKPESAIIIENIIVRNEDIMSVEVICEDAFQQMSDFIDKKEDKEDAESVFDECKL